ncbi:hypothetical protein OH687_33915 [Burkholderia anthina]|nr:hypothetical protein OH687_33915 [Burkholderia anthina]
MQRIEREMNRESAGRIEKENARHFRSAISSDISKSRSWAHP